MSYEWNCIKFKFKNILALLLGLSMFSSDTFAQTRANNGTLGLLLNENFWLIVIAVIASIMIAKYFHKSGAITVYENYTDLAYTISGPLIVWTVLSLLDKTIDNRYATNIFFVYLALHILWIFYTSFRANNSDIKSVAVAILKIFLSTLSLLVVFFTLFAIFGTPDKKNETAVEYRKRMVGIALTSAISAWVLSYIGKGLCRDKKYVSPSEYILAKKASSSQSGTPYLTITSALCLLALIGYQLFAPSNSKHAMPTEVAQTQSPISNTDTTATQTNVNINGVNVNVDEKTATGIDADLMQFAEKFDVAQPAEREELIKQMNSSLPQRIVSANGINLTVDSIVLSNNLVTMNIGSNASSSQAQTSRLTDEMKSQVETQICAQYYFTSNTSKNLSYDQLFMSKEGIVVSKFHVDYPKCSTEPMASKVKNQLKVIKFRELQNQLYSKFDNLNGSQREQIITQINQQLPVMLENTLPLTKVTLNNNIFEMEYSSNSTIPTLRETLRNTICPQYTAGEISKSIALSMILKSSNGELIQKTLFSATDCR